MRIRHFLLCILFIPSLALAQGPYPSRLRRFNVDERRGCAPLTVTIVDANLLTIGQCTGGPSPAPNNPCDMTWGDGAPGQQNAFTHTYNQPGVYTLAILYQGGVRDDIQITVVANTQPQFDIYTCSTNEVQVRVTDTNYDSYIIRYIDDNSEVLVLKGASAVNDHVYGTAGTKSISVRGKDVNSDDNCTPPMIKFVTLRTSLPVPVIDQLEVTSTTQIDLDVTTLQNVLYRLEIAPNAGPFQNFGNFHDVSTITIPGLNTNNNFYCFRLGAVDPCNPGNPPNYSATICSSRLNVVAQNNTNNLTWITSPSGISTFSVDRDGSIISTNASSPFSDPGVCGTEYCYRVFSNYTNGSTSISLVKCVIAISTDIPSRIENVTAVVDEESVVLDWIQNPAFQPETYTIFRKPSGGVFENIASATVQTYTDENYETSRGYCYRIDYVDVCGNQSPAGIEACPIVLTGTVASGNVTILNWSNYTGWISGVDHYEIEQYNSEDMLLQTQSSNSNTFSFPNDSDEQRYKYRVNAFANGTGLDKSVSNRITITKEPNLFYPKAFTPDNQGPVDNEIFKVFGQYVSKFEMKIFNRWGELMFSSDDIDNGWDGKFRGTAQPEGTYIFTATLIDETGRTFKRDGSVMLLRKK